MRGPAQPCPPWPPRCGDGRGRARGNRGASRRPSRPPAPNRVRPGGGGPTHGLARGRAVGAVEDLHLLHRPAVLGADLLPPPPAAAGRAAALRGGGKRAPQRRRSAARGASAVSKGRGGGGGGACARGGPRRSRRDPGWRRGRESLAKAAISNTPLAGRAADCGPVESPSSCSSASTRLSCIKNGPLCEGAGP